MISVTLDVNCINVNKNEVLDKIFLLGQNNKISLHKTDTADLEIIYGNPNSTNRKRLDKSKILEEDKGAFVVGHNRVGHNLVGSDKTLERLRKSSQLKEDQGVGAWGHFRWNHGKYGDENSSYMEEFKALLFPKFASMSEENQRRAIRDCIHLSTHKIYNRDFFITTDKKGILKNKENLKNKYCITVISPEEFINYEEIKKLFKH